MSRSVHHPCRFVSLFFKNIFNIYLIPRPIFIRQKVYGVLWGTLLLDYDNIEDSKTSMTPKTVSEILGISEWDGQGRANQYPNGLILVTHTGKTYYMSVPTAKERDEWFVQVSRALECNFANPQVGPFKPSKIIQSRPTRSSSRVCTKSNQPLPLGDSSYCRSCGRTYLSQHVQEISTLLQIGVEEPEKCCIDCKNAQACIIWLKSLNYVNVMNLHEYTPLISEDLTKFKATFKVQRRSSERLDMAAYLLEQGNITADEFEALRKLDQDVRREHLHEESQQLKRALDAIGEDMQMIIGLLLNPKATEAGGRASYNEVILKILSIADRDPELIDFYLPQILQAHLLEASQRTVGSMVKIDLLQQAILVISQKYPCLALKVAWSLLASIADHAEKRVTQTQYAACMVLLLQLEMATTGMASSIADVPPCKVLARALKVCAWFRL